MATAPFLFNITFNGVPTGMTPDQLATYVGKNPDMFSALRTALDATQAKPFSGVGSELTNPTGNEIIPYGASPDSGISGFVKLSTIRGK